MNSINLIETKLTGPTDQSGSKPPGERQRKPSKSLKNGIRNEKFSDANPDKPKRKQGSTRNDDRRTESYQKKTGLIRKENGPGWTEKGAPVCRGQASALAASD